MPSAPGWQERHFFVLHYSADPTGKKKKKKSAQWVYNIRINISMKKHKQ